MISLMFYEHSERCAQQADLIISVTKLTLTSQGSMHALFPQGKLIATFAIWAGARPGVPAIALTVRADFEDHLTSPFLSPYTDGDALTDPRGPSVDERRQGVACYFFAGTNAEFFVVMFISQSSRLMP
jgi:hypothetical protein